MKIIFETEDKINAQCLIAAKDMAIAIESYYQDCIRNYLKHGVDKKNNELSIEQKNIIEEIAKNLNEHFKEFNNILLP